MTILGIDPGLATVGYGIIEIINNNREYKSKCFGTIQTKKSNIIRRLEYIYSEITKIIDDFNPCEIAIEELFFSKNTKTAIDVSQARGVTLLACAHKKKRVFEYKPKEVKIAVSAYGNASKEQVINMVQYILALREAAKPDDASDALAIAICHANTKKPTMPLL